MESEKIRRKVKEETENKKKKREITSCIVEAMFIQAHMHNTSFTHSTQRSFVSVIAFSRSYYYEYIQ